MEKYRIQPTIGDAGTGGTPEKEVTEGTQNHNGKGVLFCPHRPRHLLRDGIPRQRRPAAATTTGKPGSGGFLSHKSKREYTGPGTAINNRSFSSGSP
jgi:hypothetical protein